MDIKRVERIVEHVGVGDGPDGCLLHLRGGRGSETGGFGTRRRAHVQQTTAGGYPTGRWSPTPAHVWSAVRFQLNLRRRVALAEFGKRETLTVVVRSCTIWLCRRPSDHSRKTKGSSKAVRTRASACTGQNCSRLRA